MIGFYVPYAMRILDKGAIVAWKCLLECWVLSESWIANLSWLFAFRNRHIRHVVPPAD